MIWLTALPMLAAGLWTLTGIPDLWWARVLVCLVFSGSGACILWLLYDTWYIIALGRLQFRCGPLRWSVPIRQIEEVGPAKVFWALSMGWSLRYLYVRIRGTRWGWKITPLDHDAFLDDLVRADAGLQRMGDRVVRRP